MIAGAFSAPTPSLDPSGQNRTKFVINCLPAPLRVIASPSPGGGLPAAEYLALLHPSGSRGHAFLSGPAPERSRRGDGFFVRNRDGAFVEVIGGDIYWRDTRCALPGLPETGAAWAEGRSGRYVSMARFSGRRREADLVEIGACWVDLDYYNVTGLAGWTPEQVLWLARDRLGAARLPAPGVVLRSGRGLLLVWLHDAIPAKALPRWKALQKRLHDALPGLGVDRSGLTPTKVFRIPGSTNRDARVRVLFPTARDDVERWSFDDLCREVLPKTRREIAAKQKSKAARPPTLAVVGTDRPKSAGAGAAWLDYYGKLAAEIDKLRRHRYGDGQMAPGQRDLFLFSLAACAAWLTPAAILESRLHEIGRDVAGWDARQTRNSVCSVLDRARRAAMRHSFARLEATARTCEQDFGEALTPSRHSAAVLRRLQSMGRTDIVVAMSAAAPDLPPPRSAMSSAGRQPASRPARANDLARRGGHESRHDDDFGDSAPDGEEFPVLDGLARIEAKLDTLLLILLPPAAGASAP